MEAGELLRVEFEQTYLNLEPNESSSTIPEEVHSNEPPALTEKGAFRSHRRSSTLLLRGGGASDKSRLLFQFLQRGRRLPLGEGDAGGVHQGGPSPWPRPPTSCWVTPPSTWPLSTASRERKRGRRTNGKRRRTGSSGSLSPLEYWRTRRRSWTRSGTRGAKSKGSRMCQTSWSFS
ncbi:hypothetical protein CEXT_82361 [Caerostris extrusa]|uniref:Uncharacterized protein n=1 Tax=Caerostris extrusa TaxID=172846 RepID=A0AAV4QGT4_CAEEX|nr:hypothetical protein CEXT_82361 [Caerostris extrusa]